MLLLSYFITSIIISLVLIYSLYRFENWLTEDESDKPFVIFYCCIFGVIWPISLPTTIIVALGFLACKLGIKHRKQ